MSIATRISEIKSELPPHVKLVAVSKFMPNEAILEAYVAGQRDFAENRPQELCRKIAELPDDIIWHFIGHLQTNKIKYIISKVSLIQSVDSVRLLEEINKEAKKANRIVDCLLQLDIAQEQTKQGFSKEDLIAVVSTIQDYKNIRICGLMGMASFIKDDYQIKKEFMSVKSLFKDLKNNYFKDSDFFAKISMGMSDDYKIAIEQGSNIVRIGSGIFGSRNSQ